MSDTTTAGAAAAPAEQNLILDELTERLDALKLLRKTDEAGANALLEEFGATGKVEQEMLNQLSKWAPLYLPDRFEQAHRTMIRALEVYDRNSGRAPRLRKLGPLTPVAKFFVQIFVRLITRSHQASVVDRIKHLYGRREANSVTGSHEARMLRLARMQMDRLEPGFKKKNKLGVPTFLFGGFFVSGIGGALQGVVSAAGENEVVLIVAMVALALLALASFWVVLTASGVSRKRTRICLDRPLTALWETIGAAGDPPKDQSRQFAVYSIIFLFLAWLIVPLLVITLVL